MNGDKQISLIIVVLIGDYVQLTDRQKQRTNGVQTETENDGEKWGTDRNGETMDRNGMQREMEN